MIRRRHFLLGSAALASLGASRPALLWADEANAEASQGKPVMLRPTTTELYRVRMEMAIQGNIHLAENELVSKQRSRQVPIDYQSVLDYEERLYRSNDQEVVGARRYYHEASSEGKTGGTPNQIELRKSARQVATHLGKGHSVTYALQSYLTHEELDLLEIPVNSLAVDGVLPAQPLAVGEPFTVNQQALQRMLDLDGLQASDVSGKLVAVENQAARLELQGTVQGSVAGVPTVIDLAGKLTFDLQQRTCTWVAMAIRERREIGKAEPGFEVAATVKMIRKPLQETVAVDGVPLADKPRADRLLVNLYSPSGRYGVLLDRRWQMITQTPNLSTMRMVESDRDIAQCDIRRLPSLKPGQQLTMEALQSDVQRSLGTQFSEFLKAVEETNSSQLRIIRIHALGAVEGVPVQWVFAHCSDDQGGRLLATFTMAAENVETFAGADEQFVQSLRFLELPSPQTAPSEQSAQLKATETNSQR